MTIRELFDKAKPIDRRIEKVITYETSNEELLKHEIQEYVATESIEQHFDRLLDQLEYGMSGGRNPEIGVWVSGFYGSGKSSFTKYLGFALDPSKTIDGTSFLHYLQNQFKSKRLQTRLAAMAKKYPSVVIMLDLASEQLAGATMAEISTVLYYKVMQWAGYSRDEKIAYLEFMLERDQKLEPFKARIREISGGKTWEEIKNQPLAVKALAAKIATEFYPGLFPDSKTFNEIKIEERIKENDRVKDMLDLVRRRAKTDNIIFILDEVGQYVASRDELILNLDGLAKNIKSLGLGHAWIVATAQQTLTEDDPRAVTNTAKLFKLKDRFPLTIDLAASDIKEICYTRLLSKSKAGEEKLANLFEKHGPQLRHATQLSNTKYYKSELNQKTFCKYYPFLPVHFEILLQLLSRLAKTRGGIGLRSAIKVLQDVLVDSSHSRGNAPLLADESVGKMANTVIFYDTLHHDIERPFPHLANGVGKAAKVFGPDSMESRVAKTIAVLQILEDLPVSRENVAALLHPSLDCAGLLDEVAKAAERLHGEPSIPITEVDGNLRFMSEAVSDLENDRVQYMPRSIDIRNTENDILRRLFTPMPTVRLQQTRTVTSGLKVYAGSLVVPISGDKEEIQTHIDFVAQNEYEARKQERLLESQQRSGHDIIYFLGHKDPDIENVAVEILRCRDIYNRNRNKVVDKDVEEYLRSQAQRADHLEADIESRLKKSLASGSFIFRGQIRPLGASDTNVVEALRGFLDEIAVQVFHKYAEAPLPADAAAAERFLKTERLDRMASKDDPLTLVKKSGTTSVIDTNHRAVISIKDYLEQHGQVDGRRMLDDFFSAPYGWSKDTTRYLVAAMLTAGVIKLRISGDDVTVRGDAAVNGLKNTNNFNKIGIRLRDDNISLEVLVRARERLMNLTGEQVMPLEENISKCVMKTFPDFQQSYAPLAVKLDFLKLPGCDRIENIQNNIAEILKGDASDASIRLGVDACPFYQDLCWAAEVKKAFDNGLDQIIKSAIALDATIADLPDAGVLSDLIADSRSVRDQMSEYINRHDFYQFSPDIKKHIDLLNTKVKDAVAKLWQEQNEYIAQQKKRLQHQPEWVRLGQEESSRLSDRLDELAISATPDLAGLQKLLNNRYTLSDRLSRIEQEITALAGREQAPQSAAENNNGQTLLEVEIVLPRKIDNPDEMDAFIQQLTSIRAELALGKKIHIIWR